MKFKQNSLRAVLLLLLLLNSGAATHYEKFFEIDGGPQYMYYFSKFYVGNPPSEQSAIIDTGSDTLAFPCDHCRSKDCGTHQDPRFFSARSRTFQFKIHCPYKIFYHNHKVCKFVKSYAEGSSLLGFLAEDYIRFKNSRRVNDAKLNSLNKLLRNDLKLKTEFGCTTKETGLFKTQYADGILGLDDESTMISSIEQMNSRQVAKVMSFGLCFHNTGGIMSIDLRKKNVPDDKIVMLNKSVNEYENPLIVKYDASSGYYEITVSHFSIVKDSQTHAEMRGLDPINMMIDSGTTFSHFPDEYSNAIFAKLNEYCRADSTRCGRIPNALFREDSCLELRKPDENYANEKELLASFPEIRIHFGNNKRAYILHPGNYFYKEYDDDHNENVIRLCMAIKGHEENKIILGAFAMIDNYFYFDRKSQHLKIFKENCYLRTVQLLMKRERVLSEEVFKGKKGTAILLYMSVIGLSGLGLFIASKFRRKKKEN